ncbi:RNA polymerase sigma factor [Terriglobus roseus]|uniref:RNA polymerase sigma-70 factor, ECF subfamily n=1 Tax=Terriglobus roseus TaxID=392734 RepID=A0A1H4PHM5_9BACT|nr:sigma-70 family RNA polymerase sigma factor [Terriglobus roseus]SEC06953.1 RNA polymerase sigma-70 factor, ECF subfamily [Terriglobus roseus]
MIYAEGCGLSLSQTEEAVPAITVESLVPAYTPLLFRMAHALLRNRAEADDVVQDTFLRVLQHRRSLPDVRDMRVWLVRIAWNLALDRRRKLRPDQMEDAFAQSLVAVDLPADRAIAEALELKAVMAEIERLPEAERHVLLLAAVEEMSHAEMAAVLGRSESAVRALLFRARTRLRERLNRRSAR